MRVRVERHSVICGSIQDSKGTTWGQNLHVTLSVTQTVNDQSGLAINTKILAGIAQKLLSDFDHHTWEFPCPWGLEQYGISLGLAKQLLDNWTDNLSSQCSDNAVTNVSLTPSSALKLATDYTTTRLSFRVPFVALEKFDFSLLGNRIALDSEMPNNYRTFSPLRYPFENLTSGGAAIVIHTKQDIPNAINSPIATHRCDEVLSKLSTVVSDQIGAAKSASEVYQILRDFYSKPQLPIGGNVTIEEIEVSSDKGVSFLQNAGGESMLEFRLGFNATHELRLQSSTQDANNLTYGPCSTFPRHGHRWGIRIRIHLMSHGQGVAIHIEKARQSILALWRDLHGTHLNNLTRSISNAPATSEIVLMYAKHRLELADLQAVEIELIETPKNTFLWKSDFDY